MSKARNFKIQAKIIGTSFYYVIYEKLWWGGWDNLGGCFDTQEEAMAAVAKLANTKYVTYNYVKEEDSTKEQQIGDIVGK